MYIKNQIVPSELRGQRTLAAIVFTDVVSYSARMAANEEYTLDLLRRDFKIMKELCQQCEGKVLKTIGDALLMYFSSAVKAVACAQEIQSSLAILADKLTPEDILIHRIGIHLGDVFFNGTDVLGDGVNIAARLQSVAEPGGICLSQTVYDVVKNPLALKATELVPKKLKNIPGDVPVYQIPPIYSTALLSQLGIETAQAGQVSNSQELESVIYSSGQWILFDDHFFQLETYSFTTDGNLIIQIPSKSVQDDARIQSFRPHFEQSQTFKFAYQNDGFLVKVKTIEVASRQDYQVWTITLEPQFTQTNYYSLEQSHKGHKRSYSAHEAAELKARRLLLNDPPKLQMLRDVQLFSSALAERERVENLIRSSATPVSVEDCVIQSLYPLYKDRPKVFLELARLQAIFFLKAAGVVEQVMELSLGPISHERVHVKFRGKRHQTAVGSEAMIIEFEGDCPLLGE